MQYAQNKAICPAPGFFRIQVKLHFRPNQYVDITHSHWIPIGQWFIYTMDHSAGKTTLFCDGTFMGSWCR